LATGSGLTFDASGNLQVGTATSAGSDIRLTIYDNSNSGQIALCRDAGGQRGTLLFGRLNGGTFQQTARVGSDSDSASPNNGILYFHTSNSSGTSSEKMRITGAGDVGIGTSSPTTKLTVSGSSAIITTDGTTSTGARGLDFVHSGQSYGSLLNYAQTGETALTAGYTGSSGYFLTFKTENVERVRITNTGNVGIGTSSPAAKLTVAKSFNISGSGVYAPSSASGTGLNFGFDGSGTEESWIQALRNNTSETRNLLLNSLGGNVLIGTLNNTSGGGVLQVSNGITFPATQSASSNANTLDDYEEGTWTPTGNGVTYTDPVANYTKIGDFVFCTFNFAFPSTASTSDAEIQGLPFAASSSNGARGTVSIAGVDTAISPIYAAISGSKVILRDTSNNNRTNVAFTTATLNGMVIYRV
jgi:hypothetical protein